MAGLLVGSAVEGGDDRAAGDFAQAWDRGDYRAMHELLTADARERYPLKSFRAAYENAASISTASDVAVGRPQRRGQRPRAASRSPCARGCSAP